MNNHFLINGSIQIIFIAWTVLTCIEAIIESTSRMGVEDYRGVQKESFLTIRCKRFDFETDNIL